MRVPLLYCTYLLQIGEVTVTHEPSEASSTDRMQQLEGQLAFLNAHNAELNN